MDVTRRETAAAIFEKLLVKTELDPVTGLKDDISVVGRN